MNHRWFFLRPRWIGTGCVISGALTAGYGLVVVLKYALYGTSMPPLVGDTPMSFMTAALFVVVGLAIFWDGWLTTERSIERAPSRQWTTHQMLQLVLAIISALTIIITALIGILKR